MIAKTIIEAQLFIIWFQLLLTAGVATIGALATAFYIKDIQQKIDDQEDNITALKTRYNKLVTDYEDELVADETSICKTVCCLHHFGPLFRNH